MGDRDYLRYDWQGRPGGSSFWLVRPGTKGLLIALVSVHFLVLVIKGVAPELFGSVYEYFALHPRDVIGKLRVWQLVTHGLLHDPDGIFHLLFNCLWIWFMGSLVEDWLGTRRYLRFCLGATVTAAISYVLFELLSMGVAMAYGASGMAMGLMAYCALRAPNMRVIFFVFPMRLWILAAIILGLDVMGRLSGRGGGVANVAHLGGAFYGLIYFRFGTRFQGVFRAIDRMADEKATRRAQARVERDREMRREVDRILDKVNRDGMAALTEAEKRFLKEASEKLRR